MRAFDRDLIRGGHYGQRSCEPHPKAEHMAAPTNAAYVKKVLANSEPSTHGTYPTLAICECPLCATSGHAFDVAFDLQRTLMSGFTSARPPGHDISVTQARRVFRI